jgi:hypothetical protein
MHDRKKRLQFIVSRLPRLPRSPRLWRNEKPQGKTRVRSGMRPCGPRFAKAEAFRSSPFGLDLSWCSIRGVAQSGLARLTGGQEVAGSNPVAPILAGGQNRAGEFGAGDQVSTFGWSKRVAVTSNQGATCGHLITCSTVRLFFACGRKNRVPTHRDDHLLT